MQINKKLKGNSVTVTREKGGGGTNRDERT